MIRTWLPFALMVFGVALFETQPAEAQSQVKVQGARTIIRPGDSVVERETLVVRRRRAWRERNPYFVARPTYQPTVPGERARVTFSPFTSLYYPTTESYYPPLDAPSVIRPR